MKVYCTMKNIKYQMQQHTDTIDNNKSKLSNKNTPNKANRTYPY